MTKVKWGIRFLPAAIIILITAAVLPGCTTSQNATRRVNYAKLADYDPSLIAYTDYGTYVGVKDEATGVITYKGIKYATADRFQAPKALTPGNEIIFADTYGNAAWQESGRRAAENVPLSNDCLNVNIWSADNDLTNKSVYVYIYPGAQIGGSNRRLDWTNFVAENPDIIVVMPNYRVGFWGSVDLSGLEGYEEVADLYKTSNNATRLDLVECLKWIRTSIAAFGGDPDNVTVGGQSAGSNNITALLTMEDAHQYFQKAICQSSFSVDISLETLDTAKFISADLFARLGVTTIDAFLAKSDEEIIAAQNAISASSSSGSSSYANIENKLFSPVIDGVVIPENYYENLLNGACDGIKVIFGNNDGEYDQQYVNQEDGTPYADAQALAFTISQNWGKLSDRGWNAENADAVIEEFFSHNELYGRDDYTAAKDLKNDIYLRCGSILFADALCEYTDVYMYYNEFDTTVGDVRRTSHGSENNVITRNWGGLAKLFASDPAAMTTADMISDTWAAFIRTGNPNNDSLGVKWTPYSNETKDTLIIKNDPVVSNGVRQEDVNLLLPLFREYPLLENALTEKASKPGIYTGYSAAYYDGFNRHSIYIPVDDGTKLAVDIYIPTKQDIEETKALPVIFYFMRNPRVSYNADGNIRVQSNAEFFTRYGYIFVMAEARGTGASYGTRIASNDVREARDGGHIVNWIHEQEWCNGMIGTMGMSYHGQTQYETLAHTTNVRASVIGCTDYNKYDGWMRNGVPRAFGRYPDTLWTAIGGTVTVESVVATTVPVDEDTDKRMLHEAVSQHVYNGLQVPMFQSLLWRNGYWSDTSSEYWNQVSASTNQEAIENSGSAIYLFGGLYDVFRRDTVVAFENLDNAHKMLMGPWYHIKPKIEIDWNTEHLRWFDYWLKGIDNGIMDEDPIYLKTANADDDWKFYKEWPVGEGARTTYYLTDGPSGTATSLNDDILNLTEDATETHDDYEAVYGFKTGVESTASAEIDARGLTYTSAPMGEDFEITGHPMAHINFELMSEGYDDIDVFVTLIDYNPETGEGFIFSDGHLRASLRATDDAPYDFLGLPWHPANEEDVEPLTTGVVYKLAIDLMPTSYVVPEGHRLRVTITNSLDRFYYLGRTEYEADPTGYESPTMRLYTGGVNQSYIVMPNIYE